MLYQFLLYGKVSQPHMAPLFWISFPFRSPQSTEQSSWTVQQGLTGCLFYTWQSFYVSPNLPIHPSPFFPPCCPYVSSLCLCLYFYFATKIIYTIFLNSTTAYVRYCTTFVFFLSDLLHTLYDSLQVHPHLYKLSTDNCTFKIIRAKVH